MINSPQIEPYYKKLMELGYSPLDYSEKHYVFRKDLQIIKIARSSYNTVANDDSFCIEKVAHDLLGEAGLPVAKILEVYERDILIPNFAVLCEEYYEGQVYYSKDTSCDLLIQIWELIHSATTITRNTFGYVKTDGTIQNATWHSFLRDIANSAKSDKSLLFSGIKYVPEPKSSSFIFTDINVANYIFENKKLKVAIDVERPIFGDKTFIYSVIKSRNPKLFSIIKNATFLDMSLIDYYCIVYNHLFDSI